MLVDRLFQSTLWKPATPQIAAFPSTTAAWKPSSRSACATTRSRYYRYCSGLLTRAHGIHSAR